MGSDSYQQMREIVAETMVPSGRVSTRLPEQEAVEVLNSWFEPCNGLAHVRFAGEVHSVREQVAGLDVTLYHQLTRFGLKEWAKTTGRADYWGWVILGAERYEKIRDDVAYRVLGKGLRADKRFTVPKVANVLRRIDAAKSDGYSCSVRKTGAGDYLLARAGGGSLVLE